MSIRKVANQKQNETHILGKFPQIANIAYKFLNCQGLSIIMIDIRLFF